LLSAGVLNTTLFPPTVNVYAVFADKVTVSVPPEVIDGAAERLVAVVAVAAFPLN